jgi:hypothetical protein
MKFNEAVFWAALFAWLVLYLVGKLLLTLF